MTRLNIDVFCCSYYPSPLSFGFLIARKREGGYSTDTSRQLSLKKMILAGLELQKLLIDVRDSKAVLKSRERIYGKISIFDGE